MSKPTFNWTPDLGAKQKIKPSVTQTKFGDGYEVRIPVGINYKPKSWDLTFTKDLSDAEAILAFLEMQGGKDAFSWIDPMNNAGTYVCREWSSYQQYFGVYSIAATFEQVFEY